MQVKVNEARIKLSTNEMPITISIFYMSSKGFSV